MEEDFDAFIAQQKQKIASERSALNNSGFRDRVARKSAELTGLQFDGNDKKKKQLQEERHKEYLEIQAKKIKEDKNKVEKNFPATCLSLALDNHDEHRKFISLERRRDYLEWQRQKCPVLPDYYHNDFALTNETTHSSPFGHLTFTDNDAHAFTLQKMQNGHKENEPPGSSNEGILGKIGTYEEKRKKLRDERKAEYNQMMAEKGLRATGAITPSSKQYASKLLPGVEDSSDAVLPGMRNHRSAELAKMKARNKEYNEFLNQQKSARQNKNRPRQQVSYSDEEEADIRFLRERKPKKGWGTPTYEEILEKKRREERNYRRHDDPELYSGGFGLRNSISDGNLNKGYEEDLRKFKDLDKEIESKRVRFDQAYRHSNRRAQQPSFSEYDEDRLRGRDLYDLNLYDQDRYESRYPENSYSSPRGRYSPPTSHRRRPSPEESPPHRRSPSPPDVGRRKTRKDQLGATLLIGNEVTASADYRRKEAYRKELEEQMKAKKEEKQREKNVAPKINEDISPRQPLTSRVPNPSSPHYNQAPPPQAPPPQNNGYYAPPPVRPMPYGMPRPGILEAGFPNTMYGGPMMPPPGAYLQQPMGYNGSYRSPMEDAYNYFANRNILEPSGNMYNEEPRRPEPPNQRSPSPPMPKAFEPPVSSRKPADNSGGFPFPSGGDDQSKKAEKQRYQQELMKQIEEDKKKKQKMKEEKERYEMKLEEEIRNYDPFGKGGGGAPMKDQFGNNIASRKPGSAADDTAKADLRKMKTETEPDNLASHRAGLTPRKTEVPDYSGGGGLFGDSQSDEQKSSQQRYQDDLKRQIEERKKEQDRQKELERLEEEKIMKKIEEDNQKMLRELEEEKRKEKEKAEEAQRQQDELRRQQQEKQKAQQEAAEAARAKAEEKMRQQREEDERRHRGEDLAAQRSKETISHRSSSPPIPTLKNKQRQAEDKKSSRPVSTESRIRSAEALNQLARLRKQLDSERKRVEKEYDHEKEEPLIYDPRLSQRSKANEVDVFEVARNKGPVSVKRAKDPANPKHVQDFENLKNDSPFEDSIPGMNPRDMGLFREQSNISAAVLDSESQFIDIPEEEQLRNSTARSRRRSRGHTPRIKPVIGATHPNDNMGSQLSLDPELIDKRNEERLKKLKAIGGGDDIISIGDPDDILENFMSKHKNSRPPTGSTLNDDTWMRAASGKKY